MKLPPDPGGFVAAPGFYDLPANRYHLDPVVEPSLSSSLAVTILDKSPRHAWAEHPRLGAALEPDEDEDKLPDRRMEVGSVVHSKLLGKGADVVLIDERAYQKKVAKEQRAAAYAAGKQPILAPDMEKAERIVAAAREQMAEDPDIAAMFDGGVSEAVMVWKDPAGPWCRAMLDRVRIQEHGALVLDIKTSATSINPAQAALGWKVVDMGYETRAMFYARGIATLCPQLAGRIVFRHVWLEVEPPYSLVVSELDGAGTTIGARKAAVAIAMWRDCLAAGTDKRFWPRYGAGIHRIEYPARAESDWIGREAESQAIADIINADPLIGPGRQQMPARRSDQLDSLMGG